MIDTYVRVPSWVYEIQLLSDRADCILAIRNARNVGLGQLADRYQRILDAEVKRLNEFRAFSALLRDANAYGERVAQKAHEDHPSLSPTALGNIAFNAANWYGNKALLETTLRAATRKSSKVYEITLKKDEDLDRRAYALYRSLSVGSRKTNRPYGGREGLRCTNCRTRRVASTADSSACVARARAAATVLPSISRRLTGGTSRSTCATNPDVRVTDDDGR